MGSKTPKVLASLAGRKVLDWAVGAFDEAQDVGRIVVVARNDLLAGVAAAVDHFAKVDQVVAGGPTRSASTLAGLSVIADDGEACVLVHDGARPLVTPEVIARLVEKLATADAATVATPASDTMLRVSDEVVIDVLDRSQLWHAQTPQGFRIATLRAAYAAMGQEVPDFTDDCGLVRHYLPGTPVAVVPGSADNIKITGPADLDLAERLLAARSDRGNHTYSE